MPQPQPLGRGRRAQGSRRPGGEPAGNSPHRRAGTGEAADLGLSVAQPLWKRGWQLFLQQNLRAKAVLPSNCTPRAYPRERRTCRWKTQDTNVGSSCICNSSKQAPTQMPFNR